MAVKISAQKFLEGLMSLGLGVKQGQQQGQQLALQRQDQEQQRMLSLLPHLARLEEQRRASATDPIEGLLRDPNLGPASRAQLYQQLQGMMQQQGPSPMAGLYGKAVGGQLTPGDLQGFGQGGGMAAPDLSGVKFIDPRTEDEAALLRHDFQSRVNPSQGLPLLGALRRGENIHAGTPDPRSSVPTIDTPDGPSPYQRAIENNPTTAEKAAEERAKLEEQRQKGREKLAQQKANAAAEALGLKLGSQERIAFVRVYGPAFKDAWGETGDAGLASDIALRAAQGAFRAAPGRTPGQKVLAAPDPELPELPKIETSKMARTRQTGEKIEQGERGLNLKEKDINSKISDRTANAADRKARTDAYVNQIVKNLDPEVVGSTAWLRKNVVRSRDATEARLAAGGGVGGQKWNPGLTARVDQAENLVKNAESVLGKTISEYQRQERDAAKASGVPSKHNYATLDLDQLGADLAKGKIKPTIKVGGKDVPNPQYDKFVRLTNLYRGVKQARQGLNSTLDTLAPVDGGSAKPGAKASSGNRPTGWGRVQENAFAQYGAGLNPAQKRRLIERIANGEAQGVPGVK